MRRAAQSLLVRVVAWYLGRLDATARQAAAMRLASAIRPIVWVLARAGLLTMGAESLQEKAFGYVLRAAHLRRIVIPTNVRVDSDVPLSGPLLLLTIHHRVNQASLSYLASEARGGDPPVILKAGIAAASRRGPILKRPLCSAHHLEVVRIDPPMIMFRTLAKRLAAGRVVVAALDMPTRAPRYDHPIRLPHSEVFASDGLIRFGHARGVRLAFSMTRVASDGGIVLTVRRARGSTPAKLLADFEAFVRTHAGGASSIARTPACDRVPVES